MCVCVSHAGSPWIQRCDRRLPSPGVSHPEGGLSLPRHSWLIFQRWILQFALLLLPFRCVWWCTVKVLLKVASSMIPCVFMWSLHLNTVVFLHVFNWKVIKVLKQSSSPSPLPEKRLQRSWPSKPGNSPVAKNPVVRSKSYNVPMLTPVVEYDVDSSAGGGAGIRRHSVSEMTSCLEESSSVAESTTTATNNTSTSSLANHSPASTASAALSGTTTLVKKVFSRSQEASRCEQRVLELNLWPWNQTSFCIFLDNFILKCQKEIERKLYRLWCWKSVLSF